MPAIAEKTVVAVFGNIEDARTAVEHLRESGVPADAISIVANGNEDVDLSSADVATDVAADAGIGAALGGIGGLLLGFTALVIPGIGPVMAAGPLLAALSGAGLGAVAGGLIGALSEAGVPEAEAKNYAAQVKSGNVLVTVRTSDAEADRVREGLDRHGAVHVEGPRSPSDCDLRTDDDIVPHPGEPATADVIGHNPGGEAMSADEARREDTHYGSENPDHHTWPHQHAYDLGDSLTRPEVLDAEEDPVGAAERAARRARIYP